MTLAVSPISYVDIARVIFGLSVAFPLVVFPFSLVFVAVIRYKDAVPVSLATTI